MNLNPSATGTEIPFPASIVDAKARAAGASPMEQMHQLFRHIMAHGKLQKNRTADTCIFVPGYAMYFDMKDGFPLITSKKVPWAAARGEYVGMVKGFDNAQQFADIGCKVWFQNANETPSWLASPYRKGENDLGRGYGPQWTDYRDWKMAKTDAEADFFIQQGYELVSADPVRGTRVFLRSINQLEEMLKTLMTNPYDRRMLLTGWNPAELVETTVPPCHCIYSLACDVEANELHLQLYQRSFDTFLAYNLTIGALFLEVMAKLAGMRARTFSHFIGNAHIYSSHLGQVQTQLERDHFAMPTLELGPSIQTLKDVSEVKGAFMRINHEDIVIKGYESHGVLKAPMLA